MKTKNSLRANWFNSYLILLVCSSLAWAPFSLAEKTKCRDEVQSLMEIWESSNPGLTAKVKKFTNEYNSFEVPTSLKAKSGKIKIWNWKKGDLERVVVSYSYDQPYKRDIDVRFDPDKKCNISSISFYEPEVSISGSFCHNVARKNRVSDSGQNSLEHKSNMLSYIESQYLLETKKKSVTDAERSAFSRIFVNCRNAAVIGKLSKDGGSGMSDAEYYKEEIKAHQAQ